MSILNGKITIYEGTIKKIYTDNVVISKEIIAPIVKEEIVSTNAQFRKSLFDFISLEHNTVLPTEEEAKEYMNNIFKNRKNTIKTILSNPNFSKEEKEQVLKDLARDSSCIYLADEILKPVKEINKKEIKQYRK